MGARNIRDMTWQHGFVYCATKWIGMSELDVSNVLLTLGDLSKFAAIPDRLLDGSDLFDDGNSQGAIAGGGLAAYAQDYTHAALGVTGMNYGTLLRRSVDFDPFFELLDA